MCIRDSLPTDQLTVREVALGLVHEVELALLQCPVQVVFQVCLLYTSDAADERSSVDLGGRRIIKKQNTCAHDL